VRDSNGGEEKLAAVADWQSSSTFNAMERLAFEVAECMTITGQRVDDELFGRLKAQFSDAQIVELATAVAFENFRSKLNPALGVEAQGFCLLPKK